MHLVELMVSWNEGGRNAMFFRKQLIRFVSHVIDKSAAMMANTPEDAAVAADMHLSLRRRIFSQKLMSCRTKLLDRKLPLRAMKYWLAARAAFEGATRIGIAVDAGRMMKREIFFGLMTRSNGVAAWMVPQEHDK